MRRTGLANVGLAALIAALLSPLVSASGYGQPTISQQSIRSAELGINLGEAKTRILGGPLREAYPVNASFETWYLYALIWDRARVAAIAPRTENRVIGILTWSRGDRTARGIGPCSSVLKFRAAYGHRARPFSVGKDREIVYRVGRLWFTTEDERIGVVQLSSSELTPLAAVEFRRHEIPGKIC